MHDRHGGELRLDVDELAGRRASPVFTSWREPLDDVGLRRDRIGADDLGPAQRDRLGDGARALELLGTGWAPASRSARARRRPWRRPRCPRRSGRRTGRGWRRPPTRATTRSVSAAKPPSRAALGSGRPRCSRARRRGRHGDDPRLELAEAEPAGAVRAVEQDGAGLPCRPANTATWCSSVGSPMISASGATIGSRTRISRSSKRQNATTGAPVRSDPKLGKACACRPSRNAASDEQLGGGDDALPAPPVDAHLEHRLAAGDQPNDVQRRDDALARAATLAAHQQPGGAVARQRGHRVADRGVGDDRRHRLGDRLVRVNP